LERDAGESPSSPLKQAASKHDQALCSLYEALINASNKSAPSTWVNVLREWHQATSCDEYRRLNSTLENLGAFEPPALTSEIEELQVEAMLLGAEPLIVSGRDALAAGDYESVRNTLIALHLLFARRLANVLATALLEQMMRQSKTNLFATRKFDTFGEKCFQSSMSSSVCSLLTTRSS
jgi:hypothetical protein